MKLKLVLIASLATACFAQEDDLPDPTLASPRMKAALQGGGSAIPGLIVRGIVLGSGKGAGAVALEVEGGARVMARAGMPFTVMADGEVRKLVIKRISSEGMEIEAPDQKQVAVIPSFAPVTDPAAFVSGDVAYVQFTELPLLNALRMLSDQTGNNYSASVEANKCLVNVMLANVSSASVVEEICKSHNLWFKRDDSSGILRIMTVKEFEKDLGGFREEQTEVFTLKYPNVPEIANAIANLYGDRVELSFGAEEIDAGMRLDLEGRFDRFDILNTRTQSAGNTNGNLLSNNANGFLNNGGNVTGIGGLNGENGFSGGGTGIGNSLQRNNLRNRRDGIAAIPLDDGAFRNLTPGQAERVDQALGTTGLDGTAAVEALRQRPATIYVTASRRNSMVAVRTADALALTAIRSLVTRMDVQTSLVLLEVQVVSIELGDDFQSAFDFQYNDGKTVAAFSRENIGKPGGGGVLQGGLNSGDMTFAVVSDNFRARMQFFEEKNRVKTLSTPTLLTANNEVSRLFLGEERPLVRGVSSQTIITDNNVATTPNTTTEFRNVGNTLLITPNINADRTVTLRMVQENSFIKPDDASIPVVTGGRNGRGDVENVKIDVVATRSVSGTFVAKDGLAIAVGGLIEDSSIDKRGQIPILGDIPGLGLLFQRKEIGNSRREMVIIIRPHVMSTPSDSERLSKDLLQRIAPAAVERLNEAGFFPDNVPIPPEISAKDPMLPVDSPPPAAKKSMIQQRKKRFFK